MEVGKRRVVETGGVVLGSGSRGEKVDSFGLVDAGQLLPSLCV